LIKKLGMEPDKDVEILQMSGQPQIVAGMVAGAVQAGVLSSPANYNATKADFQMFVDFKSVGLDYPTVSLVSTRSYIKKDPRLCAVFSWPIARAPSGSTTTKSWR
jgi:ABC-type nitrate/sulfonate/bicarbonate transport system substrate-binding protein